MDSTITNLFNEYHDLTGSAEAAATLVLAQMQKAEGHALQGSPGDGLLSLRESAKYLGYDAAGLRKIVSQKRIRFVQNGRGPIKFRREWLDEFIAANCGGPQDVKRAPVQKRSKPRPNAEPKLCFDSSFYLR
jgi:excisionase family DNA binding protein